MGKRVLSLNGRDIEVEIARSARRTVALYVRPGGTLLIRAPWHVPARVLMQFAGEKSRWIEKHIDRLRKVPPPGAGMTISEGGTLPFLGGPLTVRIAHGAWRSVTRSGGVVTFTLPETRKQAGTELTPGVKGGTGTNAGEGGGDHSLQQELSAMAEAWYLHEAKALLPRRTYELAATHAAVLPAPREVRVRKMKSRWGTCHRDGTIWLNRELMKREPELIDYVICHELCHLVHHNHGREFYALLERVLPGYRPLRKRLRHH